MSLVIQFSYFAAALLFILGLKGMASPLTARKGIVWAGVGMVIATVATFFEPVIVGTTNYVLIILAIAIGSAFAYVTAKKVEMTEMPQMVAIYNGLGGGSAGLIAAVSLVKAQRELHTVAVDEASTVAASHNLPLDAALRLIDGGSIGGWLGADVAILALLGAVIGTVACSGSVIAWAKLDGRMKRNKLVGGHQYVNILLAAATVLLGIWVFFSGSGLPIFLFFLAAFLLGMFITTPIGGADMPVVISLLNALTGLAVGFKGYVLGNPALIIAGIVVGAAGMLLTHLMAKAMNRPISNVLFSGFGAAPDASGDGPEGEMKEVGPDDAAYMMGFAEKVIIVPGYGMAVAQAQHKVWEMVELLEEQGVEVKFAIHPVAGRMPGHMNVLLAEAGVPYDKIFDMEEINAEFATTDVVLVIGANDVVNPAAKTDESSPIYGMPILDVDEADNVLIVKRGRGAGFSGVENHLFFDEKTRMVFGDAQKVVNGMIQTVKTL